MFQVYSKVVQLYIKIYIFSLQTFFHYRLIQDIEPCARRKSLLCIYFVYIVVCIHQSQIHNLSLSPFLFGNHKFVLYVCEPLSVL